MLEKSFFLIFKDSEASQGGDFLSAITLFVVFSQKIKYFFDLVVRKLIYETLHYSGGEVVPSLTAAGMSASILEVSLCSSVVTTRANHTPPPIAPNRTSVG